MKSSTIIVVAAALLLSVAVRLYKKYYGKGDNQPGKTGDNPSSFPSSSKEDDYEPYSKK